MGDDTKAALEAATATAAAASGLPAPSSPKAAWKSKTMWASALVGLLPLVPGVGPALTAFAVANPQIVALALGGLFAGLRVVSHGKLSVTEP